MLDVYGETWINVIGFSIVFFFTSFKMKFNTEGTLNFERFSIYFLDCSFPNVRRYRRFFHWHRFLDTFTCLNFSHTFIFRVYCRKFAICAVLFLFSSLFRKRKNINDDDDRENKPQTLPMDLSMTPRRPPDGVELQKTRVAKSVFSIRSLVDVGDADLTSSNEDERNLGESFELLKFLRPKL